MASYVVSADKASALPIDGGKRWTLVTDDATVAAAESGDLVICGSLVGVAVADYDATNGEIVLDVVGGYELPVTAKTSADPQVNSAIAVGDWLFYDATNDEINKGPGIAVGQSLEAVDAGGTGTIGVKLNPLATHTHGEESLHTIWTIPIADLSKITGTGDVLTEFTPGFAGAIQSIHFAVGTTPVTTADKDIDLQLEIGTTLTTGGLLTLLSADLGTMGAVVDGSAITGNNTFAADDSISLRCVEATAAHAEGNGYVLVVLAQAHDHAA